MPPSHDKLFFRQCPRDRKAAIIIYLYINKAYDFIASYSLLAIKAKLIKSLLSQQFCLLTLENS